MKKNSNFKFRLFVATIFRKLRAEIVKDITSRKDMITFSFKDKEVSLQKIF